MDTLTLNRQKTFDEVFSYMNEDLRRITSLDAMYLQRGDVVLVRSQNVPEKGDHYIVVIGPIVEKEWGLRPETVEFPAPYNTVLDLYDPRHEEPLVALKLSKEARDEFFNFYGIYMENGEVKL